MGKQRVKFTFPTEKIKEPIIYQLGRDFSIVTNIRRADIREEVGWVVTMLKAARPWGMKSWSSLAGACRTMW